jgi:hypothetical protein
VTPDEIAVIFIRTKNNDYRGDFWCQFSEKIWRKQDIELSWTINFYFILLYRNFHENEVELRGNYFSK